MTIPGVKNIESRTLKSFRIKLEPKFTNGHDFCELIINEMDCNFTARLYGGETYSHSWEAPGDDFIQFLIDVFSEKDDYLFVKLEDSSFNNYLDIEKTADNMKKIILESRKNGDLDKYEARELWDDIELFSHNDDITINHFYEIYMDQFRTGIEKDVFSDEPWFEEFIEVKEDFQCRVFCEKVAPILAEVLKQEYAKA